MGSYSKSTPREQKKTSLAPHTLTLQNKIRNQTNQNRKQWDLYRHLMDPYLLAEALSLVIKNDGTGGIDRVTIDRIKGHEWGFVKELAAEMKSKSYKPLPVKRVFIPKSDQSLRPLGIPALRDRVIQRALVLILEPIYELRFLDLSYGFRPAKSARDCAAKVADLCYHHRHVIDADIEAFFDRVEHRKLMGMLKHEITDPRLLKLIQQILKAGFIEPGKPWQPTPEGTPQGGPLSPLLANIYLHYSLDKKFAEWNLKDAHLVRYADDFVVLAKIKQSAEFLLRMIKAELKRVGLNLKESKTRLVNMKNRFRGHESHFNFLGFKFHLRAFEDCPKRFWVARQPSEKSRKNLSRKLKESLMPNLSLAEAKKKAKEIWDGWSEYFRYSNANRIFYRQVNVVRQQLARYLRRKFRRQRRPVPWNILYRILRTLTQGIRPKRVINDLVRQKKNSNLAFDF
ncbi:MAG TPA: group II intron reverse transcriptase/maturase [Pseudobdellovibrionaceae bacterium]